MIRDIGKLTICIVEDFGDFMKAWLKYSENELFQEKAIKAVGLRLGTSVTKVQVHNCFVE